MHRIFRVKAYEAEHGPHFNDEEMAKCQALLDKLGINDKPAKENDEIIALQKEVNELKNIIRKANQMVPPPMKEMLPQDMKNAMDKVGQ